MTHQSLEHQTNFFVGHDSYNLRILPELLVNVAQLVAEVRYVRVQLRFQLC